MKTTELTLKELAPYLPYGLNCICTDNELSNGWDSLSQYRKDYIFEMDNEVLDSNIINHYKPILRPLSEFENYFSKLFDEDIDVRTFLNEGFITQENQFEDIEDMINGYKVEWWPHGVVQLALKHHFDVFGLIESGLAIDINTIK